MPNISQYALIVRVKAGRVTERERETERERQTDRETDRETEGEREKGFYS